MTRQPGVGPFLIAAERFAARCVEIAELTRMAFAVPGCERLDGDRHSNGYLSACTDRLREQPSTDYEAATRVMWWEATEKELTAMCVPCQSRVALWRERHEKRKTIGGLKRALLASYRAEKAQRGAAA